MSDYYVGESCPPPLPPPRRSIPNDSNSLDDYETFSPDAPAPPPLPPPNVTTRAPPPLPKKSGSVSSETDNSPISPSRTSRLAAAFGNTLQDGLKQLKSSAQKNMYRMSSYDAPTTPPVTHPRPPLTPPLRRAHPLPSSDPPIRRAPLPSTPEIANRPPLPTPTQFTPPLRRALPPPPESFLSQQQPANDNDDDNFDESIPDYEDFELNQTFYSESHPSDGISLLQFITKNQDHFPAPFEVSLGFSACSEEASISEGERFIANFLKRNKVLTVEDDSKELYAIPLNTSFQFALLHDPNANKKEAMSGFVFKTAGDLMITRSLPKVIRARKSFRGISPESSVIANELLYVKEVVQKESNRRYVKCVQASTGKEKQLHEECLGEFSTLPHDIRDYLPNLLKHFQLPFKAVMCLGIDNEEDIPPHLVSAIVTVSNLRTEESLIATTVVDDSDIHDCVIPDTKTITINDIPLSYDINVKPLNVTPLNAEKMIEQTEHIFQNFNPAKVFPYLANQSSSQLALMKSVRKDTNMQGIELLEPKILSKHKAERSMTESTSTSADSADVAKMNAKMTALENRLGKLEKHVNDMFNKIKSQETIIEELKKTQSSRQSQPSRLSQESAIVVQSNTLKEC